MRDLSKWKVVLTIAVAGWILQGPALAETKDNANRMTEIVVTAKPLSGSEAAGTVHRITAEQIRQQGADTLDEALEMVPGVIVREGPEGTPRIDIRGFRTRHVQLFINGIPIRETFDDQFDPTTIAKNPKYDRTDDLDDTSFQAALSGDPEGPFQYRVWGYHNQRFQEDNRYDNTMTANDPDTWTQERRNS